jgi:hypothetical protein
MGGGASAMNGSAKNGLSPSTSERDLTPRQKEAIKASWKVMSKNQKAIGLDFFVT